MNDCEYMTAIGCPARDAAKSLILQEITESQCPDLDIICKEQCCKDCDRSDCGYRCGRTYKGEWVW